MQADIKIEQKTKQTATLPIPKEEGFKWKHCWYPVTFSQDLPKDRPYSFSLYDEPFVVFRNQDGKLACLTDRCPHRAARLSDGQMIDGRIECLYHGWQFGSDGECLFIPQLPAEAKIPANACVQSYLTVERQGIVWVWAGEAEAADEQSIPTVGDLDKPEFVSTDYMRDLPYDQTYFIENVIDPAHVHISHDGILGNRECARPLEIEVIENSAVGIRFRGKGMGMAKDNWGNIDFIAPNLVLYRFSIGQQGWSAGVGLYSIPLGKDRCRILLRNYVNFMTQKIKLTPRWLDHIKVRNQILEGDLQLVVGQKAQIERLGKNLKEVYLPLKTSDTFVIEYRKWLDKFGSSLPFYQGYSTEKHADNNSECNQKMMPLDRFSQHTQMCSSCNRAYQVTNQLKQTLVGVAIVMAAWAIVIDGYWSQIMTVLASLLAVVLAVIAQKVKNNFERSYQRR